MLYLAREIFVPLALALLLAFLLEPLARRLELCRLGRTASVLLAILAVAIAGGAVVLVVSKQLSELTANLPQYKINIHKRIQEIRESKVGRAVTSIQDFQKGLSPVTSSVTNFPASAAGPGGKPIAVEIRDDNQPVLKFLQPVISPSLSFLVKLLLVAVFCIFMLIGRDDLRARLIRIVGPRHVKLTLGLLVETDSRLSRYLLTQLAVNVSYGIIVGLALWLVGLPNPLLWGISAALFRYIPYVGPWIGASLPFAMALAVDSGWTRPFLVLVIFATLEISTANFAEPWLYGRSAGITAFGVLFAAVFWTWLWGPVGLLLSIPLTVVLASIAKYFPELEIIDKLFGKADRQN